MSDEREKTQEEKYQAWADIELDPDWREKEKRRSYFLKRINNGEMYFSTTETHEMAGLDLDVFSFTQKEALRANFLFENSVKGEELSDSEKLELLRFKIKSEKHFDDIAQKHKITKALTEDTMFRLKGALTGIFRGKHRTQQELIEKAINFYINAHEKTEK